MTMYELRDQIVRLQADWYYADSDEERKRIEMDIEQCCADLEDEAEVYARLIRNAEGEIAGYELEIERLTSAKKARKNLIERLKGDLLFTMQNAGMKEVSTSIGKWRTQRNNPSCEVLDDAAVPAKYHLPQPDKIDRLSILRDYRATGEVPDGCEIRQEIGLRFK